MNILLPTDFSDNARHAHEYAFSLFGKAVHYILLNAVDKPHTSSGMLVNIEEIMKRDSREGLDAELKLLRANGERADFNITIATQFGTPASVASRMAEKGEIDMVVMGTQGASGIKKLLVGSNAAELVSEVPCSVLAVPASAPLTKPTVIVFAHDMSGAKSAKTLEPLRNIAQQNGSFIMLVSIEDEDQPARDETGFDRALDGIEHSFHIITSENAETGIDEFVQENQADMVAMIPRHTGFFDRIFHKSVTRQVVMHTRVPLLSLYDK